MASCVCLPAESFWTASKRLRITCDFLCSPWVFSQSILSHQEFGTGRVMLTWRAIFNILFFPYMLPFFLSPLHGEKLWTCLSAGSAWLCGRWRRRPLMPFPTVSPGPSGLISLVFIWVHTCYLVLAPFKFLRFSYKYPFFSKETDLTELKPFSPWPQQGSTWFRLRIWRFNLLCSSQQAKVTWPLTPHLAIP